MNKLSFLLVFLLFFSCSKDKKTQNGDKGKRSAIQVKAIIAKPKTLEHTIHATGTLLANEEVELRSEVSGRIIKINFQEGQPVKQGQLLIKIEDDELKAQLRKVQLQIELAATEENRSRILLEQKGISRQDYDIVLNKLNSLKADAEFIEAQINKTSITAPFSGSIGLRNVSEGSLVSASTLLATMQQSDPVKIEFSVPERYASFIKPGLSISFTTNQEKNYTAKVYASEQKIDFDTRSIKVRARCANPKRELIPGSFVRANVNLSKIENTIVLPAETIVPVLAGQTVFTLKSGKAHSTKVITGIRTESEVQILDGIQEGDTIITTGIMMLREGAPVKLQSLN